MFSRDQLALTAEFGSETSQVMKHQNTGYAPVCKPVAMAAAELHFKTPKHVFRVFSHFHLREFQRFCVYGILAWKNNVEVCESWLRSSSHAFAVVKKPNVRMIVGYKTGR